MSHLIIAQPEATLNVLGTTASANECFMEWNADDGQLSLYLDYYPQLPRREPIINETGRVFCSMPVDDEDARRIISFLEDRLNEKERG